MEDIFYRQMPHSLEAEQSVLGSMLIDANCVKDVMEQLRPDDFYLKQNREIFETIYSMFVYSKPIDGVTVAGEMERNGTYDENTTRNYLVQLMEVTPTSANVNEYADIVRDKALLRAIATVASDITGMVQDGTGGASAVLDAAEQKIYAVRRGRSAQNMEQISVVLQGVLDHLAELSATGGKTLPGLSTGLSAVDDKINGLSKSDLILLAARPGMGKTSFALNVALNVAKASGKAVAVFSLEMSKEQLVTRVLSNEALVENGRLISGNLRESDWVKIAEAYKAPLIEVGVPVSILIYAIMLFQLDRYAIVSGIIWCVVGLVVYYICHAKYGDSNILNINDSITDEAPPSPEERAKMDKEYLLWKSIVAAFCIIAVLLYVIPLIF